MALSTYSDLQASVLNWMARDGSDSIAAIVPDAIAIVETKFNRILRVAEMEATATLTANEDGTFTLPSDFLSVRRISGAYGTLDAVTPEWAADQYPTNAGGPPSFYAIKGSTLTVYPGAADGLTLDYCQKGPAPSSDNPINWLRTRHPDGYLVTPLVEVNAFTKDAEAAGLWNERAAAAVDAVQKSDNSKRFSRMSARVKGPTP